MRHFLRQLDKGLFDAEQGPIQQRIAMLLAKAGLETESELDRIRILNPIERETNPIWFGEIAEAVLQRNRIRITYHDRSQNKKLERILSPQRLVHYRHNWYLDAWCHLRQELRTFSLDRIRAFTKESLPAKNIKDEIIDDYFSRSYGIFSGEGKERAVLIFNSVRARWIADKAWYPDQKGFFLEDGRYQLELPFGNPTELIMEILKYGKNVEVVAPKILRNRIIQECKDTLINYK